MGIIIVNIITANLEKKMFFVLCYSEAFLTFQSFGILLDW